MTAKKTRLAQMIAAEQIKRLQRVLFSTPVEVDVVSDNPSHKVQRVEMERLCIIGRVAGRVSVA